MPGAPCRSDHLDWVKNRMSGAISSMSAAVCLEMGAPVMAGLLALVGAPSLRAWRRHGPQLHHERGHVVEGPALHDLAVLEAVDDDVFEVDRLVVGQDAEKLDAALVRPGDPAANDHLVAVGDHVFDDRLPVGEGLHRRPVSHLGPGEAGRKAGGRVLGVVEVGREQVIQRVGVPRVPGLFDLANDLLVLVLCGHVPSLVGGGGRDRTTPSGRLTSERVDLSYASGIDWWSLLILTYVGG